MQGIWPADITIVTTVVLSRRCALGFCVLIYYYYYYYHHPLILNLGST